MATGKTNIALNMDEPVYYENMTSEKTSRFSIGKHRLMIFIGAASTNLYDCIVYPVDSIRYNSQNNKNYIDIYLSNSDNSRSIKVNVKSYYENSEGDLTVEVTTSERTSMNVYVFSMP